MKTVIASLIISAVMSDVHIPAESYEELVRLNKANPKLFDCIKRDADQKEVNNRRIPADKVRKAACEKAMPHCHTAYAKAIAACKPADKKIDKEGKKKMNDCFKNAVEKRIHCGGHAFNGASTLIMSASAFAISAAFLF